jgi:hypothetical protein
MLISFQFKLRIQYFSYNLHIVIQYTLKNDIKKYESLFINIWRWKKINLPLVTILEIMNKLIFLKMNPNHCGIFFCINSNWIIIILYIVWDHHLDSCKKLIIKFTIYIYPLHNCWINININCKIQRCNSNMIFLQWLHTTSPSTINYLLLCLWKRSWHVLFYCGLPLNAYVYVYLAWGW